MAKLSLALAPTFKANVLIPVPGKKPVSIEFTFRGRTRNDFKAYIETMTDREDVDILLETISGWELEDDFNADTVEQLTQVYPGSGRAIIEKYIQEVSGARLGN